MGNKFIFNYCIFIVKYMDTFANLELRNVCVVNNYWKNCFNSMLCLFNLFRKYFICFSSFEICSRYAKVVIYVRFYKFVW